MAIIQIFGVRIHKNKKVSSWVEALTEEGRAAEPEISRTADEMFDTAVCAGCGDPAPRKTT